MTTHRAKPPDAGTPAHGPDAARREAAIHEAAHAVVAWQHGLAVHAGSIETVPGHHGMALHHDPRHLADDTPAGALHAAVIAAEVSYAGELAVQAYLDRLGCGNEEDISQIADALQRVCASREQLLLMARWVEQRVRDRLEDPTTRAQIEAVGDALMRHGTLDARAFERLMTGSTRATKPP